MPTKEIMDALPPFPDSGYNLAEIRKLNITKLRNNDPEEVEKLLASSIEEGFFLLDLNDEPAVLEKAVKTYNIAPQFFSEPLEDKLKFEGERDGTGYKALAVYPARNGKKDMYERCGVMTDLIMGKDNPEKEKVLPQLFKDNKEMLASTTTDLYGISKMIVQRLAEKLQIDPELLHASHDQSKRSLSAMRFLHYPPQPEDEKVKPKQEQLPGHTDNGIVTILFNSLGGLQIMPGHLASNDVAREEDWKWVKIEPGCAIVNLGDSLVQMTAGTIRSDLHRVAWAPGQQAPLDRYSFAYFLKPANDHKMTRVHGGLLPQDEEDKYKTDATYVEWHKERNKHIYAGTSLQVARGGGRDVFADFKARRDAAQTA